MMNPKRKSVKVMTPRHRDWDDFQRKLYALCPSVWTCSRHRSKQCSDKHARAALRSFGDAVDVPASLIAFQAHGVGGCDCRIAQKRSWAKPPKSRRRMIRRKSSNPHK
jgi:hypothetical protein